MKNTSKSWKTNIVAALGAIILIGTLILVGLGKTTFSEATPFLGGLGAVLATISSYLSKDATASHTMNKIVDPDKDELPKTKF